MALVHSYDNQSVQTGNHRQDSEETNEYVNALLNSSAFRNLSLWEVNTFPDIP